MIFLFALPIARLLVDREFGVAGTRAVYCTLLLSDYVCLGVSAKHDRETFGLLDMYMVAPDSLPELGFG